MENYKIFVIVSMCLAIAILVQESSASRSSKNKKVAGPCDACPRKGKCVPKICCPAHVRPDSTNPECHLENGQIGICCYTGRRHAAISYPKNRTKSFRSKFNDLKKKIEIASKAKWSNLFKKTQKLLDYSDETIISPGSPEYGHRLSFAAPDKEVKKLAEGALLNLFAAQDLKKRQAIDDDELQLGYGEDYEGQLPYCPPQPVCPDPPNRYRSINGQCNNPNHPTWGASNTAYESLLPPDYSDDDNTIIWYLGVDLVMEPGGGSWNSSVATNKPLDLRHMIRFDESYRIELGIWSLRTSKCNPGEPLPSPRAISAATLPDGDYPNDKCNLVFIHMGQFFAHDLTSAVIVSIGNGSSISCCAKSGCELPPDQLHWACAPISIAPDDEFYSTFNKTCMNFVRAQPAPSSDCSCGYARPMNGVTHFLDLSQFYGKTDEKENELRGSEGKMKIFDNYGRALPPQTDRPECLISRAQGACFDSGDNKGNQNSPLTCIHTLFTREHNRIATELARLNPGCDNDALFYSTKRIMVGMYQKIFYDWLALLIGPELIKSFDLGPCDGHYTEYDPEVNPSIMTEFTGAAFRLHSAVTGHIKVVCPGEKISEFIRSSEVMFEPKRFIRREFFSCLLNGMCSQPMQNIETIISREMTNYMFRANNPHGLDIASLNIARGRDLGLRPYNEYRQLCGLKKLSFKDFPKNVEKRLASVYACADDIDLWIGGLLEEPACDAVVGRTFGNIIAEQAFRLTKGDAYHYCHGPETNPTAFSPNEKAELNKASISRMICDNTDGLIKTVPRNGFFRSDLPENPSISCDDPSIPSMDLSVFKIL